MDTRSVTARVVLPTALDRNSRNSCIAHMSRALSAAEQRVVVDCSAVRCFDDDGLALLFALVQYADRHQIGVVLVEVPTALRLRIECGGLAWMFELEPSHTAPMLAHHRRRLLSRLRGSVCTTGG